MKRILIICLLIWTTISCVKADIALWVWTDDAPTPTKFLFEDKPLITFGDNSMLIESNNIRVEYSMQNFVHFSFSDPSDIKELKTEETSPVIRVFANEVTVSGLRNDELVSAINIEGSNVYRGYPDVEGVVSFSLPAGIFIISIGQRSFKIII